MWKQKWRHSVFSLRLYYLRVRDCCECFVFKYTNALTVQWTRKFQYCTKRSWVQYWKFRVHCTVSKCVYLKTKHSKQSLTLLIFNLKSLLAIDLQWLPARPVWMNTEHSVFRDGRVNYFSIFFLLNLGKSWTWSHVRLKLKNTAQFLCVIVITHSVTLMSLGNGNSRDQF